MGAMMKPVRNNASDIKTMFGGVCWVPIALRKIESTITIRVKDVTTIKIEGARLKTVIIKIS